MVKISLSLPSINVTLAGIHFLVQNGLMYKLNRLKKIEDMYNLTNSYSLDVCFLLHATMKINMNFGHLIQHFTQPFSVIGFDE